MATDKKNKPKSIGVIMDGNRRWAKSKGLPVLEGHEAGYRKLKELLRWAKESDISTVYAYAFSTENWNRSKEEVGYLMKLLYKVATTEAKELIKEKVRIKFIGQIERFSPAIKAGLRSLEKATALFKGTTLLICLSYGGRAEILNATEALLEEKKSGKISERDFEKYLWTAGFPDPELIIRTSGEMRTSNFLSWQSAYSEWFFVKTFWPAFSKKEFDKILNDFALRERRAGR